MDLPGFIEEPEKEEGINFGEEKITPIIPDSPAWAESERDCPSCGGSGPCYVCERGRNLTEKFKKRQKQVERKKKQRGTRKKAS